MQTQLRKALLTKSQFRAFSSVTLELSKPETYLLEKEKLPTKAVTNKEELMDYFRHMSTMRRIEILADNLYKQQLIRGFCHLADGQEGIAMGMSSALTKEDPIISAYRIHNQAYMAGETPYAILAELMQKKTGSTGGKGGSMHYYAPKGGFYGGHGIVGAQLPMGTGLAFGCKYSKKPNVAVAMYGDGASNQGQMFEAVNMAALWKLPCIYVCENNLYGMGTSIDRSSSNTKFYTRGQVVPGLKINGQNAFEVREVFKWAKDFCLKNGPLFIEVSTYRYHGHSMSDPGVTYRTREEIQDYRQNKDPIEGVRQILLTNSFATEKELKQIEKDIRSSIEADVEKIKKDDMPGDEEYYKHIFKEPQWIRDVEYGNSAVRS